MGCPAEGRNTFAVGIWSEKTTCLYLRHVIGARVQHACDYDRLRQEIFGRLVLFNVRSLGTTGAPIPELGARHERATDLKSAFEVMSDLLLCGDADVEGTAGRHVHPMERCRSNPRKKRTIHPVCLTFHR